MEKKTNNAPKKEQVIENDNNKMVVEFETVDGYMAALERKHEEETLTHWKTDFAIRELKDYIENDYKGFGENAEFTKYYVMSEFNFTPMQYLKLKYLQNDTSARNNIGDFIASWKNASAGSIIGDLQNYAKVIVRHADLCTDTMELVDLAYYIVFKLEEKAA